MGFNDLFYIIKKDYIYICIQTNIRFRAILSNK